MDKLERAIIISFGKIFESFRSEWFVAADYINVAVDVINHLIANPDKVIQIISAESK